MNYSWQTTDNCVYFVDVTGKILGSITPDYLDNKIFRAILGTKTLGMYISKESAMAAVETENSYRKLSSK